MKKVFFSIMIGLLGLHPLCADDLQVNKENRDLICGIEPYKHPKWATEIELINDKKLQFVSVKCMMLFYYKNSKWDDLGDFGDKEPIKTLSVQDFESLKVVDAKKAYYVFGSKVVGPKGDDLIPFEHKAAAENFMKTNGGSKILTWDDFKLNLFDFLNL